MNIDDDINFSKYFLNRQIAEKKKKLKKDGRGDESIPEDDADKYKHSIYVMVMKVSIGQTITFFI